MGLFFAFFLFLFTIVLSVYLLVKWIYSYWERQKLPYVKASFPLGSRTDPPVPMCLAFKLHYDHFKSQGLRFGGVYSLLAPALLWVDHELIKNVLTKDFQHFVNRGIPVNKKADPLSIHLFNLEGKNWKDMRIKLTPTFTSGKMKMMFQILVDCSENLVVKVGQLADDKVCKVILEMGFGFGDQKLRLPFKSSFAGFLVSKRLNIQAHFHCQRQSQNFGLA